MDSNPLELSFVSGETFREIFQTSAEGIIMVNERGKILLANPVCEKMFGYAPETLAGRNLDDLLPERYRSRHAHYRSDFNSNPSPRRMGVGRDLQALRQNGSEFPVEISLSYTLLKDRMVIMAFITDITQRKIAEDALRRSEEQLIEYAAELEKKVQLRTEALNLSVQKLENLNRELEQEVAVRKQAVEDAQKALVKERELNELKSRFVSIASHEFRTPLSAILSSTSLIHQYIARGESAKAEKHIERIKSSVDHLTNILNDFLSLGKLEEGRTEVNVEIVHISAFFADIQEEFQHTLKEGQQLTLNLLTREKNIATDPKILRSVLFNLLSNASKYSGNGKTIQLNVRSKSNTVEIEVVDEGIGIPQADVKHVFDRFFRASNSSNIQGTGLGLNIVKRYVELLDGQIGFSSTEGKGSIFTITLPITSL